jgi:hypothetical protein
MNVNSRALAEFLRANLDKVPTPAGYEAFREKVKSFKPSREDRRAGQGDTHLPEDTSQDPQV